MESHFIPGDPVLVENIVSYLKAMGVFDEFRHECLADVDTKSSCQNLSQRVDGYTAKFLANETWNPDLNKNEVRNKLRKHIDESGMLAVGADHVVEQVINPKVHQLFLPKIIEVVHQYLKNETEKLHKRQETANSEKLAKETANESTAKAKTAVLDPIADILSFTYSKPKLVTSAAQNSQSKSIDVVKVEKKKEDIQTKSQDTTLKTEKKEDGKPYVKTPDPLPKIKKEELSDQISTVNVQSSEKNDDVTKFETMELIKENLAVSIPQNIDEDSKEIEKVSKEIKVEECGQKSTDIVKKSEKDEVKHEKKKTLKSSEKLPQSEENVDVKSSSSASKNSLSKNKLDLGKHKKNKSSDSAKIVKTGELHKSIINESSDSSSDKLSGDQSKVTSKLLKPQTKDKSSSLKNNISTQMVKCEKGGDSITKSKLKPASSKSSDKSASVKISSSKKDDSSSKVKPMSEKSDKTKYPKISDSKSGTKKHSESSLSSDKGSKTSSQYSSSYESSQGSDPDKSSSSNLSTKEKLKHFSKHQRKDATSEDKTSFDKKQSDSDSGTPNKDKSNKVPKSDEHKKSIILQEAAKISSRSDSLTSTSSSSDSQTSVKESSINTSGESSDTSSKPSEKKKLAPKDKEPCTSSHNLPPPSPPPPAPGLSMPGTSSSAELSSMEDTQSSPESEASDASEDSEEDMSNESDGVSSDCNEEQDRKEDEFIQDIINDVFLCSSSSSEFEGFLSSPEKNPTLDKFTSDVSVSSVHTSDLSSFEDEISEPECTSDQVEKGKSSKRFTIKEAEEILKAKAEKQRLEALKLESQKALESKKNSRSSIQNTTVATSPAEPEVALQTPEPKRESRRERKLNPKYASNEYTSIFNSKRTSFITKQNEGKQTISPDTKKTETDSVPINKRKTSTANPDEFHSSKANSSNESAPYSGPSASKEYESVIVEYSSEDISSDLHSKSNLSDKNHNTLSESDSRSRIALKIKISASKNDNETNKVPNTHGTKRKLFDGEEKRPVKKPCHKNSLNSSGLESVANENKPLNDKSKNSSAVLSVGGPKEKEVFHKQKVNNGDVLNKAELVKNNSISKTNHVNEKQP